MDFVGNGSVLTKRCPSIWFTANFCREFKLFTFTLSCVNCFRFMISRLRWFLAWTLEQPLSTASGALCPHNDKDKFQVTIATAATAATSLCDEHDIPVDTREQVVLREITDRVVAFCDSSPGGWDLAATVHTISNAPTSELLDSSLTCNGEKIAAIVRIRENMPPALTNFVDETEEKAEIPESILQVLRGRDNSGFLPKEGHFLVDVKVRFVRDSFRVGSNADINLQNRPTANVHLDCYRHSARGGKAIEKIRNSLNGEINRTNRKWRKIRKRQEEWQLLP